MSPWGVLFYRSPLYGAPFRIPYREQEVLVHSMSEQPKGPPSESCLDIRWMCLDLPLVPFLALRLAELIPPKSPEIVKDEAAAAPVAAPVAALPAASTP